MKLTWKRLFLAIAALALVGVFVLVSGIVPIKASSGHWPVTRAVLDFAKTRSVKTHSSAAGMPDLDEPRRIRRGAGAFHSHCFPCHGGVAGDQPVVPRQMTPTPPALPPGLADWQPEDLFYIVAHGIKFTGMPAWPADGRDDEVWDVVAFLRRMPGLDEKGYRELAGIALETPELGAALSDRARRVLAESCARCHGFDGNGAGDGAFPRIAGQSEAYLRAALDAYSTGERNSGVMRALAAPLKAEIRAELAAYYAVRSPEAAEATAPSDAIERGRRIAHEGVPAGEVPSCIDCHGPGAAERKLVYPFLAGQPADYLELQLGLFHREIRGGSDSAHLMLNVAPRMSAEQRRDVSHYYESLSPRR